MQTARIVTPIAVFAIVLVFPLPSRILAQQTPKPQPLAQPNETQLRSFAKAYVQIEKIRQTYEPQMKQAKNPEEGKQIQNEAMSKMHQALIQEGMNEQSYNQIFDIARADEAVRKKLIGFINEERQKS